MRQTFWQLAVAAALVVLLGVLGTLQYRWLGEVSQAERARLRDGLRARAQDFTQQFDRELTHAYVAFHVDGAAYERDPAGTLADAYTAADQQSTAGSIVKGVYVFDARDPGASLQRLDRAARTLVPSEWPAALAALRARVAHLRFLFNAPGVLPPFLTADAVDASAPALVVPIGFTRQVPGSAIDKTSDVMYRARSIVVLLDGDRLKGPLLGALVEKHFGTVDASEYAVSVVKRSNPAEVLYASPKGTVLTPKDADLATGMFDLRLEELSRIVTGFTPPPLPAPPSDAQTSDRLAITIVRKAGRADGQRMLMTGGDEQGAWQVLIRFRQGSLDALVAQSRRRNLAIGLGVLGLLGASFIFVIASAQRQQRLARQQMEFVAAVSHELRTPLAVIRSAGENLADGVVADGAQVKRYGSLIGTEGRRLSEMVERVMEFAGISSGAAASLRAPVDVDHLVAAVVDAVAADARERGVKVAVSSPSSVRPILGDAGSLRSAMQNVVGNAVKYSRDGAVVRVDVESAGACVRVRVRDDGIGIDGSDLPHVFKPFYRGRRAVDAQIRGTGLGLSVVRRVIDAHGGDIAIESRAGEGTTVVITLPAGEGPTPASGEAGGAAEARATT